jgi:hypothetical protein
MKAESKKKTANKKKFCVESECSREAVSHGYCRLHYIAHWKHIKLDRHIKAERRLNAYVDRIAKKYPKDYLDKIKEGLENEEKFRNTMEELELDGTEDSHETEKEFLEKFLRDIKVDTE